MEKKIEDEEKPLTAEKMRAELSLKIKILRNISTKQ
jgi:hypothetical protein